MRQIHQNPIIQAPRRRPRPRHFAQKFFFSKGHLKSDVRVDIGRFQIKINFVSNIGCSFECETDQRLIKLF